MKIFRLISITFLLFTGIVNAQTDFRPGYIISNDGDTLYGEIDYRGDIFMSRSCVFKESSRVILEYSPDEIVAFRFIDSKYYVSREIDGKMIFLEYLIKGKISVYYFRNGRGNNYFLEKEDMPLVKLPYEEFIRRKDDFNYLYKSRTHVGILNYYLQDAPSLKSDIEKIKKPGHNSLIRVAKEYQDVVCKDEKCIIFEKQLPPVKFSFEPFLGTLQYVKIPGFVTEFGFMAYLWLPRLNEKIFFKTGLVNHKINYNFNTMNVIKIPLQLMYIYRAVNMQPRVSAGINLLRIKENDSGIIYDQTFNLNVGFNYKLLKGLSISTCINTDFIPIRRAVFFKDVKFSLISYSFTAGLFIDL